MAAKFDRLDEGKYQLDVRGMTCPHPQLYTKKSLEKIQEGDQLSVLFDSPSSGETIAQMCDSMGHELLEKNENDGVIVYVIEKG